MAGKTALYLAVTFSLFIFGCAASNAMEKPAPGTADNDKAHAASTAPEVKDPKAEAKEKYTMGLTSMTHGNLEKAEGYFLDAIKLDPEHYKTRLYLGRVYEDMGKRIAAIEQYKTAVKLKPDDPAPYACLIGVYIDMNLLDYAISTADDASKKGIKDEVFAGNLGWVYYLKGDYGNAEKYLKIEKKLRNADSTPHNNLGLVYFSQGRYDDALACFNEASELNKNSVLLPYFLAVTYYRLGREDEAVKALQEGLKRDPNLEKRIPSYNASYFPRSKPDDLSAVFKKLKEEKN